MSIQQFSPSNQNIKPSLISNPNLNLLNDLLILQQNINYVIADRYNFNNNDYNSYVTELILSNKNSNLVSKFKDYLIYDYIDEYLTRFIYHLITDVMGEKNR